MDLRFSAYFHIMLYVCTKFHKNAFTSFDKISILNFIKWHNSVQNYRWSYHPHVCTSSDYVLYLNQVGENISKISELLRGNNFPTKFSKGHNSIKNEGGVMILNLGTSLDVLYICSKFHENISKGF